MNYRLISLRKERIYYGTRTYKQNGQVVKEFERLVDAADLNYGIDSFRLNINMNIIADTRLSGAGSRCALARYGRWIYYGNEWIDRSHELTLTSPEPVRI